MNTLTRGDRGPEVRRLQTRLTELGFRTGGVDGDFGGNTEGALRRFQGDRGIDESGRMDDATFDALFPLRAPRASVIDAVTVGAVAYMFPATRRGNIETHLPFVVQALTDDGLTDRPMVVMALATIRAETEGFVPIDEGLSHLNTDPGAHPFNRYDSRDDLGNQGRPDGERFKGRGFVQLTGRHNYGEIGAELDLALLDEPGLANRSDLAARILARFLQKKQTGILEALTRNDLRQARRLVNGGSHGIDRFEDAYTIGVRVIA